MTTIETLEPRFTKSIPENLEEGVLYISTEYGMAAHRCCCGCKREVMTPLSPTDWKMVFDGETVSLTPSIGNWSFPCRSHYWVKRNCIEWSYQISDAEVELVRAHDRANKHNYYENGRPRNEKKFLSEPLDTQTSWLGRLRKWWNALR